jgi:lysyl-tRNA synthetase class I
MDGDSESRMRKSMGIVCTSQKRTVARTRGYKIVLGSSWGPRLGRAIGIIAIGEVHRLPWLYGQLAGSGRCRSQ